MRETEGNTDPEDTGGSAGAAGDTGEPPTGTAPVARPGVVLGVLAAGQLMVGLSVTTASIANPRVGELLGATTTQLQWTIGIFLLVVASLLIISGRIGDRFGRKRVFMAGVAVFGISSLVGGLSPTIEVLIFSRAIQGLGGALVLTNAMAVLRSATPPHLVARYIGIFTSMAAVGTALGPVVGGLLVEYSDWRAAYWVNMPVALVVLLLGVKLLPESRVGKSGPMDVAGLVFLVLTLAPLTFGVFGAQSAGWTSPLTLGSFAVCLVALVCFLMVEHRYARDPLLPLAMFRYGELSLATALVVVAMFSLVGSLFFLGLYLQNVLGFSPFVAGIAVLPLSGSVFVASNLADRVVGYLGELATLLLGLLLVAAAFGVFLFSGTESDYRTLLPAFLLIGIGVGLAIASGSQATVGGAPVRYAGAAAGLNQTSIQIGGVFGTAVLGTVMTGRVADSLSGELTASGVPGELAADLSSAEGVQTAAQGAAPIPAGATEMLAAAITQGSHEAFVGGMHQAMSVGILVCLASVVLATLFLLRRGAHPATRTPEGH